MNFLDNIPDFKSAFRQHPQEQGTPLSLFGFSDFFGASKAGTNVTAKTALTLPAFYSAVRLIAETIASLPLQVFEDDGTSKKLVKDHPIYRLIHDKPNQNMTSFIWRELIAVDVMLWGNHYSLITKRVNTVPTELTPFPAKDVKVTLLDGKLWYTFKTTEGDVTVDGSNVVHIKMLSDDGLMGKSIIQVARENLGLGLAEQDTASNFYGKGMQLGHAIESAAALTEEALNRLRKTIKKYEGVDGERTFFPLDAGMKITPLGVPPQDAQFLESRKFSVTDIARWLRVPPPLIYDLERATFSNISELILSFVKFSLTPWLVNIETELNDKLFLESEKGTVFAQFNVDGLLRGDIKQRADVYKVLIQNGVFSPNDALRMENKNTYKGGDDHYVAANMVKIEGSGQNADVAQQMKELIESKNGEVPVKLKAELLGILNK